MNVCRNQDSSEGCIAPLLKKLYENAKNNANAKSKFANRHENTIMNFAVSLYCLVGRGGYEMLLHNFKSGLPSLSRIHQVLAKKKKITEGEFLFDDLLEHLKKFHSPLAVNIQLDDTRIVHKIEHDSVTDRFVGFILPLRREDGTPLCNAFRIDKFEDLKATFEHGKCSKFAHCITAQPVDVTTPSFVLFILITGSKYTADIIQKRWNLMDKELGRRGINIISFGADGAGPFLKAMVDNSRLFSSVSGTGIPSEWSFFVTSYLPNMPFYCQDTVHILAKLRTKLVTESNLLEIGTETACWAHLQYLVKNEPKSVHGLTVRCIDQKDKQNFESVSFLVSDKVLQSLETCKQRTKGTIFYLKLMRNIRDAFLNKALSPIHRIYLMWKTIFVERIWQTWLEESGPSQTEYFITPNAYTYIEINGHLMVNIALKVASGDLPKESLRFWKTGSQSCESMFRLLRSMTPTFSTIINFTLRGMLDRLHKLSFIETMEASGEIEFPRAKRRLLQLQNESNITLEAPTEIEIYTRCFAEAKKAAKQECKDCNMSVESDDDLYLLKGKLCLTDLAIGDDEEVVFEIEASDSVETEMDQETATELRDIELVKDKAASLPSYIPIEDSSENPGAKRPRTYRKANGFMEYQGSYIRKTTACYLLQEHSQVSNDRVLRVREIQLSHLLTGNVSEESDVRVIVKIGDLCVFRQVESEKLLLGQIVQFSYLEGNKRERQY